MNSVSPPCNVNHGGSPDTNLQLVTIHFGHRNPGDYKPILYARNPGREPNDFDMLTGVVYPRSRLVTDGLGRTVADENWTGPIAEDLWLL